MKKASKKATACAVLGAMALAGAGSMALFTDRIDGNATATAGTLDLVLAGDDAWAQNANIKKMIPGFILDMDYTLTNEGNKSMDVRETITITSASHDFKAVPEFLVYKTSDVTVDTETGAYKATGTPIAYELDATKRIVTIKPDTFTLNGNPADANAEVEDGVNTNVYTGDYVILFAEDAANTWLGNDLTVDYVAEAKQHRNTGDKDTWTAVENSTTALQTANLKSGATQTVVPVK